MIRNVVFDFGQVLVHFEPADMVKQSVSDPEDARLLEEVLFDRIYWDALDAGTISDEEVMTACRARLPRRLWASAEEIYFDWIHRIPEWEGMYELLVHLKEICNGKLCLLSNISTYFAHHAHEIRILGLLDECVYSSVCGFVKPQREIYAHLCRTCELIPEETVFVDDRAVNIAGAEAYGIHGYLFDGDVPRLRAYLDRVLSEIARKA